MATQKELHTDVNGIFQELHSKFSEREGAYLLMSHFGEFSQDLVNSLSEGLEYIMRSNNAPKILTKRMFSIMIEGLQNIRLHGARNHENKQLGHVMIMESNDEYTVSIGNVVDIKSKVVLTNHLNMINNMSHQEVKDYYISVLTNGVTTEKGGAGLGFVTLALKSQSTIEFDFIDCDTDHYYFEMCITLSQ